MTRETVVNTGGSVKSAMIKLLAVAVSLLAGIVKATVEKHENSVVAADLCKLGRLATSPPKPLVSTPTGREHHSQIHALNISPSPPELLNVFEHGKADGELNPAITDKLKATNPWPKAYSYWLSGVQYLKDTEKEPNNAIKKATEALSDPQKARLKTWLQPVLKQADRAYEQLTAAAKVIQDNPVTTITANLNTAVYGQSDPSAPALNGATIFGTDPSGTRANVCDHGVDNTKMKSLAATLMCVSAPSGSDATAQSCFTQGTTPTTWNGQGSSAKPRGTTS